MGLRAPELGQRRPGQDGVEDPVDVGLGLAVAGQDEAQIAHAPVPSPQRRHPGRRLGVVLEGLPGLLLAGPGRRVPAGPVEPGARVGAEEAHVGAPAAQRGQRLPHRGVGDVPAAVEEEPVLAAAVLQRARLDAGEVDPAHGDLGEDGEQRAGTVRGGRRDRGAVVAGGRGQAGRPGRADQHEPRHGVAAVVHPGREGLEPVVGRGHGRAHRGVDLAGGHLRRGGRGGAGEAHLGAGQVLGDPAAGLGLAVRVRRHAGDVGRGGARAHQHRELHPQQDLPHDHQRRLLDQPVHRRGHAALDGVLDGHARRVRVTAPHRVEHRGGARQGVLRGLGVAQGGVEVGGRQGAQRLFAERAVRAEERHAQTGHVHRAYAGARRASEQAEAGELGALVGDGRRTERREQRADAQRGVRADPGELGGQRVAVGDRAARRRCVPRRGCRRPGRRRASWPRAGSASRGG